MKKHLLLIIFSLFAVATFGQSKIYLNEKLEKVNDKSTAVYLRKIVINPDSTVGFKDYYVSDKTIYNEGQFKDVSQKIYDGHFIFYNHGIKHSEGTIKNNKHDGKWKYFSGTGNLKEEKVFVDGEETGNITQYFLDGQKHLEGKIINNQKEDFCIEYDFQGNRIEGIYLHNKRVGIWKNFKKDGTVKCFKDFGSDTSITTIDTCFKVRKIYRFVQQMPAFIGGEDELISFIHKNLVYPKEAKNNKIEGRVLLTCVIDEIGAIENIKIVESPNKEFTEAAIDVIEKMPQWIPGRQNGVPTPVQFNMPPIEFHLQ